MTLPSDFGLPHAEWNPHQLETIWWAQEVGRVGIIEAPTGSGKSTIPAALSQDFKVLALVKTKFLQEDNYERGYNFIPLYGRANYTCPYVGNGAMANECQFAEAGMEDCPEAWQCDYFNTREAARNSERAALNYAYWLHVYHKWPPPAYLVCDEGHQLPEITLEWAGCTFSEERRVEWGLDMFPMIRSSGRASVFGNTSNGVAQPEDRAVTWLTKSIAKMEAHVARLTFYAKTDGDARKLLRKAEADRSKLEATKKALEIARHDWYIRSGPQATVDGRQAFIAKPLTAKHHFKNYFLGGGWKVLIMSATIGDPHIFAGELGLLSPEFLRVPSRYKPEHKPVHALDIPRLGMKAKPEAWERQADEIARVIKECPLIWSGIVHTTSIAETMRLAERLGRRGLASRLYVPQKGLSTNETVRMWHQRMERSPGSILLSWALHEGYNGTREKINICAKVPYPALSDDYDRMRREYNPKLYLQRTAWLLEQISGRSRRGPSDYDTDGEMHNYVAIADGGWKQTQNYLSQDFRESIVED